MSGHTVICPGILQGNCRLGSAHNIYTVFYDG
jgi:hypothetical protein